MTSTETTEIVIPSCEVRPATLITARSYFIDRFLPECEIISLPARPAPGGTLRLRRHRFVARAPQPAKLVKRIQSGMTRSARKVADRVIVDLRLRNPHNWAHFLDNHLPIYFRICQEMDLDWGETLILLPKNIPRYILNAAALFGLDVLATDDDVEGEGVEFEVEPWTAIRPLRVDWVRNPKVAAAVTRATAGGERLPERVFLARSDTRRVANEDEVEAFLGQRGFRKLYPERLSVTDQFRLFREAEMIVAVHGAGLAPLIYLPPEAPLALLVEILPCGHMTDFYRVIADKLDRPWTAVRGRIKPEYVEPAYRLGEQFETFSLDSFEVDVVSLERALDFAAAASGDAGVNTAGS